MTKEDLLNLIKSYDLCISHSPLPEEPDPGAFEADITERVPQDQRIDPFAVAQEFQEIDKNTRVYILIPGTQFDAEGTRVGKGGGWYDRFLSKVPKEWLRVGICSDSQFSEDPLTRNPWDEPMDYVAIREKDSWRIAKSPTPRTSRSQK